MPFGEPGADWLLLGSEVELRRTNYDLESAARRARETAYPQAEEFAARNIPAPPTRAAMLELLLPLVHRFPGQRTGQKIQELEAYAIRVDRIRDAGEGRAGPRVVYLHAALAQRANGCFQVGWPDADVAQTHWTLRVCGRKFQECVACNLQVRERWLAFFIFDSEGLLESHHLRVEAHGFIEILDVDADVVETQAGIGSLLGWRWLHQENARYDSRAE
jgi:hypothetical protein